MPERYYVLEFAVRDSDPPEWTAWRAVYESSLPLLLERFIADLNNLLVNNVDQILRVRSYLDAPLGPCECADPACSNTHDRPVSEGICGSPSTTLTDNKPYCEPCARSSDELAQIKEYVEHEKAVMALLKATKPTHFGNTPAESKRLDELEGIAQRGSSALGTIALFLFLIALVSVSPFLVKHLRSTETNQLATIQVDQAGSSERQTKPVYLCGAPTKKGTPCKRRVKAQGARCWQHQETKPSR